MVMYINLQMHIIYEIGTYFIDRTGAVNHSWYSFTSLMIISRFQVSVLLLCNFLEINQ